jgi:hypothetical protein
MLNSDLTPAQQKTLLKTARNAINHYCANKKPLLVPTTDKALKARQSCFVTLTKNKKLRGCMGQFAPSGALIETVRDMAVCAAVKDNRFSPVQVSEMPDIHIQISLMSPLKRCQTPDDFEIGRHGVILRGYGKAGAFLPEVATKMNWDRETLLNELAAHKAGLDKAAWKDKANTQLYRFETFSFSESTQ